MAVPFLGLLPAFQRDPLGLLTRVAREYGDVATLPLGRVPFLLLSGPAQVDQVLVAQSRKFVKSRGLSTGRRILGEGLLVSEGEVWRRQRRLVQPAFHRQKVKTYGSTMVEHALQQAAAWQEPNTVELHPELARMLLNIFLRAVMGVELAFDCKSLLDALDFVLQYADRRARAKIRIPERWPTPDNRRFQRSAEVIDALVYRVIEEVQANRQQEGNVVATLLQAAEAEGTRLTPKQVRDEVVTLMIAGFDTTATTMSWALYLLASHPEAQQRLVSEVRCALGDAPPTVEDVSHLVYTAAVVTETLRLYPSSWVMVRKAMEPFELNGATFPTGTEVILNQWAIHRDERYYANPEAFRPERWLDGLAHRLPGCAYFPFGAGPRHCLGREYAMSEMVLLLATLVSRVQFSLVPGQTIRPRISITLRPGGPIQMMVQGRDRS